jgi:hypothetical protein
MMNVGLWDEAGQGICDGMSAAGESRQSTTRNFSLHNFATDIERRYDDD